MDISKFIAHTLPKATTTEADIIKLCKTAKQYQYNSICVEGTFVKQAKQILENTQVKICAAIGSTDATLSTKEKIVQAKNAIINGADLIEVSINLNDIKKKNYNAIYKDIEYVKEAINKTPLNICIELPLLNKNQLLIICDLCLKANINCISTSSIFLDTTATLTAVKIIKKTVRNNIKIKAYGNINKYEMAIKFLDTGADFIGTQSILKKDCETLQIKNSKTYREYLKSKNKNQDKFSATNV